MDRYVPTPAPATAAPAPTDAKVGSSSVVWVTS